MSWTPRCPAVTILLPLTPTPGQKGGPAMSHNCSHMEVRPPLSTSILVLDVAELIFGICGFLASAAFCSTVLANANGDFSSMMILNESDPISAIHM